MTVRLFLETLANGVDKSVADNSNRVRAAAIGAIKQAAIVAVDAGRQNIRSAGLPGPFATGYRYRLDTKSEEPSATISDRLGFISIFEEGQSIGGKPLLWLPLSNLPQSIKRLTPKQFAKSVAPLQSIVVPGKPPLLGAAVRDTAAKPRVTVSRLKRGRGAARGILSVVPIFVGVPIVNIKKRLNLKQIVKNAGALVPLFYARNMQE